MTSERPDRPGRLAVGVVGAGRVGAVLGSALRAAGHAVVGVSAVSAESRNRAETLLPGVPVLEVPEVVARADLVLLAVPDDVLAELVGGLAELSAWRSGQIVVHTSGRYGARVLDPVLGVGAIPLALHPAMTFTGTSLDLSRMTDCVFAVTAPAPVLPIGQALVLEIGGDPVVVEEERRGLYHAALAHGANHLVVLVDQAAQVLAAAGVADPGRALGPLLHAALDGALRADVGTMAALTGPVARGDVRTVEAHLSELSALAAVAPERGDGPPVPPATDVPASYRALARAATQRSLAAGRLSTGQAQALLDALQGSPPGPQTRPDPPTPPGPETPPDPRTPPDDGTRP